MKTNLRSLTMAAACAASAAFAAPAAADTALKASIWFGRAGVTQPFEWFAKEVAARTGGQVRIDVAYGPAKPTEGIDLLKSGALDIAFFCAAYHLDKMPLATVLDLPMFAPEDTKVLAQVELALADHAALQDELRRANVRMLFPMPLHSSQLMGTKRIARLDDLKGTKIRIPPAMGQILQEYGATPVIISPAEAIAGMKSGTLDLVSLPYPNVYALFKIHESSKYVTEKISLGTQHCFFGMSHKAWDALPAKGQQVMRSLRQPAMAQFDEVYAREDAAALASFKQQGIEFVTFNPTDRARLVARAIKYWQAWVDEREKQGVKGREVFEFTQAKIREYGRK